MATKKQKKFVAGVKKNLRSGAKKATVKKIATDAGYKDSTAEHPTNNIIDTRGVKELLTDPEFMGDVKPAEVHKGLLKAEALGDHIFPIGFTDEKITAIVEKMGFRLLTISVVPMLGKKIVHFAVPEGKSRKDGLDMFYKVTGGYAPIKTKDVTDEDLTEEEIEARLKETEKMAKRAKKFKPPTKGQKK